MNPFKGRHFQRDIILWAVRWYCKYGISYRELQEMLAERGVNVDHSTIYRWVQRYAPEMEKRLRWYWRNPSDLCPWHMDETYVKVNGRWAYLYRAVDSRGRTVDFYRKTSDCAAVRSHNGKVFLWRYGCYLRTARSSNSLAHHRYCRN
ncbi:IS6 family transposase, partial [Escherichia coli]|uniref:IS6 family transposase n=1 Tax=Escherichia coli TaxID=562 RepID=UPI00241EFE7A